MQTIPAYSRCSQISFLALAESPILAKAVQS